MKTWLSRLLFLCSIAVACLPQGVLAAEDPASELDASLAKLEGASYRKRDQLFGPMAAASQGMSMVTEVAGGRSRLVMEMSLPQVGKIRQEQIKVGKRSAVRMTAPELLAKLQSAKHDLTMSSARSLFRQLTQVAMAMQTGGLSTAQLVMEAAQAAMTAKSTAEARNALNHAITAFDSWMPVKEEDDEAGGIDAEVPPGMPVEGVEHSASSSLMQVEKKLSADGKSAQYIRRPSLPMPPGSEFFSIISVDTATGFPTAEENYMNGQRIMRTEYTDFGAPISIEIPDCLK